MKNAQITRQLLFRLFRPLVAGVLLAVVALPVGAVELKTSDGNWTFSISGNVNVHYIYSECEDSTTPTVAGGLACQGTLSGSNVSNISNGLLPAAFSFGVTTTQNGIDIGAHLRLYPGIVANDVDSPTLAQTDYTTPEISGFSFTVGIFDPINSIGDAGTTVGKKAPGIHGKLSDTVDLGGGSKLYFSVAALEQKQDHVVGATTFDYDGTGI